MSVVDSPNPGANNPNYQARVDAKRKHASGENKNKKLLAIGAPLAAAGLAVAAYFTLSGGEKSPSTVNTASQPTPESAPPETITPEQATGNLPVQKNTALGIVQPTIDDITVSRPDGQKILVPRLRGTSPSEFADSFLTLYACYATTGDTQCVDAINAATPQVREVFIRGRQDLGMDSLQQKDPRAQAEIAGDNPFFLSGKTDEGFNFIELRDPQTLFLDTTRTDSSEGNIWQNHHFMDNTEGLTFTELKIDYTVDLDTNEVQVQHFRFNTASTSIAIQN